MSENSDTWIWDRYWQFNRLASCFDTDGSNYPDLFFQEWGDFFKDLPKGAEILDLCTGNGAVARIAAEVGQDKGKEFSITGVDLAKIDPENFAGRTPGQKAITFLGEVKAEDLPFPDDNFQAIISQFGFEYTDIQKTVPELGRVLKQSHGLKLLCHCDSAVQVTGAQNEITQINHLLLDLDVHAKAKAAISAVWTFERQGGNESAAKGLLQAFQDAINGALAVLRENPGNTFLYETIGLLKNTFEVRGHFPLEVLLDKVEDARMEALAHKGRLEALTKASVSPDDVGLFKTVFAENGFSFSDTREITTENEDAVVGRVFEFELLA